MPPTAVGRRPIHILTGFLGSGKTTLLRHLLSDPSYADTAVVVNEFGEVGVDDALIRGTVDDVTLLASGCMCCAVRDDLSATLNSLMDRAEHGVIPPFRRILIETSGLAEPGTALRVMFGDPSLRARCRTGRIVTTLDAATGLAALRTEAVSVDQVAVADHLVVTKRDLVFPATLSAVVERARAINPLATVFLSGTGAMPAGSELFPDEAPRGLDIRPFGGASVPVHDPNVGSFVIERTSPVSWPVFTDWLDLLLTVRGDEILRIKGILAVREREQPVLIQTVQHVVHPPETYVEKWPVGCSRLVVIARNTPGAGVAASFRAL